MTTNLNGTGIDTYFSAALELQLRVVERQRPLLIQVAAAMQERIRLRQHIFIFGTCHSHMLAEEAFYRAGGLAAVVPIFSSALMLHEHPEFGSRVERTPGLAESLLANYQPQPGEMIFIVSNSGVNHLPVEMALAARTQGLLVVSISSFAYALVAPLSALGRRLDEVADLAIDNGCLVNNKTREEVRREMDAVIPLLGFVSHLGAIARWGLALQKDEIEVNQKMETNLPGVYAAGDIVTYPGKHKLIATGFGEAAMAVCAAKMVVDPTARYFPGHSPESAAFEPGSAAAHG